MCSAVVCSAVPSSTTKLGAEAAARGTAQHNHPGCSTDTEHMHSNRLASAGQQHKQSSAQQCRPLHGRAGHYNAAFMPSMPVTARTTGSTHLTADAAASLTKIVRHRGSTTIQCPLHHALHSSTSSACHDNCVTGHKKCAYPDQQHSNQLQQLNWQLQGWLQLHDATQPVPRCIHRA